MNIEEDIAAAEAEWAPPAKLDREDKMVVTAATVFEDRVLPLEAVRKRRAELGVENAALCTREQRSALATVNGLCRKVNGEVERLRKALVEEHVRAQKVVNGRAKEIKEEVAEIQKPILQRFAEWDAEDAAAEREKEEAERRALEAALEAEHAAERKQQEVERKRLEETNRALIVQRETERLEKEKLQAELAELRAAQAAAEKATQDRLKAEAVEKARQEAAAREQARLEAIRPDAEHVQHFGMKIGQMTAWAPHVLSEEALATVDRAVADLNKLSQELQAFGA